MCPFSVHARTFIRPWSLLPARAGESSEQAEALSHSTIANPRGMKHRHFDVCQSASLWNLEAGPRTAHKL